MGRLETWWPHAGEAGWPERGPHTASELHARWGMRHAGEMTQKIVLSANIQSLSPEASGGVEGSASARDSAG